MKTKRDVLKTKTGKSALLLVGAEIVFFALPFFGVEVPETLKNQIRVIIGGGGLFSLRHAQMKAGR